MIQRKSFWATMVAFLALLVSLYGCGGGGGAPVAVDSAPPVVVQSVTTLSLSISEKERTVRVNTITTTDSANAVAPVTEAGAVTINKATYDVAGGLVKNSAGGNLLLPLDVKTTVSALVHLGGQVLQKTVDLMATCGQYTKNVGGNCLYDARAVVWHQEAGAIFHLSLVDKDEKTVKDFIFDGKTGNLALATACVHSASQYTDVRVTCKFADATAGTYEFGVDGSRKTVDAQFHGPEAEYAAAYIRVAGNCNTGKGSLANDGQTCLTQDGFDFIASRGTISVRWLYMRSYYVYGAQ